MSSYNSSHELAAKMDSEGGLGEFIFGYGLSEDDLPDDMPSEIFEKFVTLLNIKPLYDEVSAYLWEQYDADPKPGDYDYEEPALVRPLWEQDLIALGLIVFVITSCVLIGWGISQWIDSGRGKDG